MVGLFTAGRALRAREERDKPEGTPRPGIAACALGFESVRAGGDTPPRAGEKSTTEAEARKGRDAMQSLSDDQLVGVYSRTRVPDLSVATMASRYLVRQAEARAEGGAGDLIQPLSAGFPGPVAIPAGCNGVDIAGETRYALLIAKEVTSSILAAARAAKGPAACGRSNTM